MMDRKIIIDGIEFDADKDGCISICENIDKISTLIPFLTMLQRNGYEELYLDYCNDIVAIPSSNQPERSKREDRTLLLTCQTCGNKDLILYSNAQDWQCPMCKISDAVL